MAVDVKLDVNQLDNSYFWNTPVATPVLTPMLPPPKIALKSSSKRTDSQNTKNLTVVQQAEIIEFSKDKPHGKTIQGKSLTGVALDFQRSEVQGSIPECTWIQCS